MTGFNLGEAVYRWSDYTAYRVWGIILPHSQDCVVRLPFAALAVPEPATMLWSTEESKDERSATNPVRNYLDSRKSRQ